MARLPEHAARREVGAGDPPPRARPQPGLTVLPGSSPVPDLEVRLHSPRAEVVVVRVSGTVDERGAGLLGERVRQQLARAAHVVVDLAEVPAMPACGTRVLADLARDATRCDACLHITGVEDPSVRDQIRLLHLHCAPCAEAVVALLPPRLPQRRFAR